MDDVDAKVLEMERRFYVHGGAKVQAIYDELELSETGYFARLVRLLDDPEAEVAEPVLIHRLRRLRDERQRARTGRRTG